MRKFLSVMACSVLFWVVSSCTKQEAPDKDTQYMSYDSLRKSVVIITPPPLKNPGKIYTYKDYVFINEVWKGIHIYDNKDPVNIKEIAYINIPGNYDMAVQNDILYADNAVDLVQIDISDMNHIHELRRVRNVFPYSLPPDAPAYLRYNGRKGLVTGWKK